MGSGDGWGGNGGGEMGTTVLKQQKKVKKNKNRTPFIIITLTFDT